MATQSRMMLAALRMALPKRHLFLSLSLPTPHTQISHRPKYFAVQLSHDVTPPGCGLYAIKHQNTAGARLTNSPMQLRVWAKANPSCNLSK